ncbi:hypothetical protein DXG01_008074 [Tephrocybe rancida]|nr:hypothetical protein DXG01_008074 [Tephrocybe rancida]
MDDEPTPHMIRNWVDCEDCFDGAVASVRRRELEASLLVAQQLKALDSITWSSLVTGDTGTTQVEQHVNSDDTIDEVALDQPQGEVHDETDGEGEDVGVPKSRASIVIEEECEMKTTIWILRDRGRIRVRRAPCPLTVVEIPNHFANNQCFLPCHSIYLLLHMASESKTAEFARLFDFFERLASHNSRSRTKGDKISIDDLASTALPADLAPVVNNLAGLVGTRNHKTDAQKKTGGRKRSHTIATTTAVAGHPTESDNDDDESLAKFPLGKKYTFTFRLMLHKLYQMDEWKQKVKDVLERSQIDYKPLAETTMAATKKKQEEGEKEKKQDGRVHFKAGIAGGSRRPTIRTRANSVLALGRGRDAGPLSPHLKSPIVKTSAPADEEVRAIKKRCVGRRKSMSGPLAAEAGRIGGSWVYDAAVSSAEISARSGSTQYHSENNVSLKSYAGLGLGVPGKVVGKRRVSLGGAVVGQLPGVENGVAKRRRALSVMDNMTPIQAQRKRRLEV